MADALGVRGGGGEALHPDMRETAVCRSGSDGSTTWQLPSLRLSVLLFKMETLPSAPPLVVRT